MGSGGAPENAVAPAVYVAVTGLAEGVGIPIVIWVKGGIPGGAVGITRGATEIELDGDDAELAPGAGADDAAELAPDTELAELDNTADDADGAADKLELLDTRGATCLLCLTRLTS